MKNKFWFQAVCWIGWLGLTAIAIYTTKTDIRIWTILILAAWIGLVVGPALRRCQKTPALPDAPILTRTDTMHFFIKRLKANTWFQSFVILAYVVGLLWLIPWFTVDRHPFIASTIAIGVPVLFLVIWARVIKIGPSGFRVRNNAPFYL